METKPIAWSHSALNNFDTCAKQYHETRVLKNFQTDSEDQRWGRMVHKELELALRSGVPPTGNFEMYAELVERFRNIKGTLLVEQQLAIRNNFQPTGWFAPDVWCRGVIDALWIDQPVARLADWKSGKRKLDAQQLQLSALLCFAHYPEVDEVVTSFVWLQTGKMDIERYHRDDVSHMWQELLPKVRRFEHAHKTNTWVPKPSGLCKGWCPVKTCAFWDGAKMEQIA